MPLYLYSDIYSSNSVPKNWTPAKNEMIKYPVRNQAVLRELRTLTPGKWKKL